MQPSPYQFTPKPKDTKEDKADLKPFLVNMLKKMAEEEGLKDLQVNFMSEGIEVEDVEDMTFFMNSFRDILKKVKEDKEKNAKKGKDIHISDKEEDSKY